MPKSRDELTAGIDPLDDAELARMAEVVMAGFKNDPQRAIEGLSDTTGRIRALAVAACGRLGVLDEARLQVAQKDPDPAVRLAAARAAAKAGSGPLSDLIRSEKDPLVAEAIIFAAGERREEDAYALLCETALEHPDPLCREAAVAAIANFEREDSLEVLTKAAKDRPPVRRRAAVALAAVADPRATEVLRRLAQDRDWQTRQIAKEILAIEEGSES